MQTALLEMPSSLDVSWLRAAIRECIAYGEHGIVIDEDEHGHKRCFNCQGAL